MINSKGSTRRIFSRNSIWKTRAKPPNLWGKFKELFKLTKHSNFSERNFVWGPKEFTAVVVFKGSLLSIILLKTLNCLGVSKGIALTIGPLPLSSIIDELLRGCSKLWRVRDWAVLLWDTCIQSTVFSLPIPNIRLIEWDTESLAEGNNSDSLTIVCFL